MCRNITELRGLEPPATETEVEAAARQFVRKVSGLNKAPVGHEEPFEAAIAEVALIMGALLDELPPRRQPTTHLPPLRRRAQAQAEAVTA
ncbi:MAG: hypothetical protein JWM89_3382 [Acidimicrobiales bacterium]|nr:hypothetical protein [Acidimicrobiales bacterium]